MLNFTSILLSTLLFFGNLEPAYNIASNNELPECVVVTHCVRESWRTKDVESVFKKVEQIINNTPRTKIVRKENNFIHAEAKTKWLKYTDDLLIKAIPDKGIVQVRSESRVGIGDNGVNRKRINNIAYRLMTNQTLFQVSDEKKSVVSINEYFEQ